MEKIHMNEKKPSLFQVCFLFFYMGLTTFGGAASMLVCLTRELVDKRGWLTEDELYDEVAVAQCSPGIIMVNTATLFGMQTYGLLGAILTTLSLLIAPFTCICLLTLILRYLSLDNELLSCIYSGIRAGLCGISINAVVRLGKKNISDLFTSIVAVVAFVSIVVFNIKTVLVILIGIILGLLGSHVKARLSRKAGGTNNNDASNNNGVTK